MINDSSFQDVMIVKGYPLRVHRKRGILKKMAAFLVLCLCFSMGFTNAGSPKINEYQNQAELDFPTTLKFSAELGSDTQISRVKLHYGTTQDTCGKVSSLAFPETTPGKRVKVEWDWDMRQSGGEPPGATIWWQWEVVDENGNSTMTDRKEITWLDAVHDWKTLTSGLIRLHYYYNSKSYGTELEDAATKALSRLSTDIGIKPDQPIDLYIYSSTQDMKDAIFYEPGWTGGQAYPEYNIVIIGIEPSNLEWGKATEAHEMTHVLVGDYTFSCLGSTPTWLDEGLAVYGEGGPTSDEVGQFQQSQKDDTLLSFTVLSGGFSEDSSVAGLSYSQSYYMVDYLIKTYGKEKMLELLQGIKDGGDLDDILKQVYGFDLSGFEDDWRTSLGLKPMQHETAQEAVTPTLIPTIIPVQGIHSQPTVTPMPVTQVSNSSTDQNSSQDSTSSSGLSIQKVLPWILGCFGFNCVLLIVLFFALRKKGGRQ